MLHTSRRDVLTLQNLEKCLAEEARRQFSKSADKNFLYFIARVFPILTVASGIVCLLKNCSHFARRIMYQNTEIKIKIVSAQSCCQSLDL
jgi:hypothetical protein